eukprot:gnl/MRDRNA2_/MRDRNA2_64559_c0_seq2.p1 gnl/MRDRNA2_/MRDRNA2_64559_c0~~gnl/MRDRNA2_/MRDRNA2_64559_c0_seq2.p1  ORF type:complete len:277 (-),score=47.58 gnl/MRDRNA2_/MRDRNA2_64559_c0_seq2:8-838(-)
MTDGPFQGEVDVAIIGAGTAGLACAARLRERCKDALRLIVLEATECVGGRARTVEVGGYKVDIGAGWIHGVEGNPLLEDGVISDAEIVTCTGHNIWTMGPAAEDSTNFRPSTEEIGRWHRRLEKASQLSVLSKCALQATDEQWTTADERLLRAFELWFGAPLEELCSVEWSPGAQLGDFPGPHAIIKQGMSLVIERLLERAGGQEIIRLGVAVEKLTEDNDGVLLCTSGGVPCHVRARWVVCAIPLGALKNSQISVVPSLSPALQDAISSLSMSKY